MSSKDLARYVVRLEAETAKYQKGLEDARRQLGRFDRRQRDAVTKMAKQFGVLAAAAVTTFAALVRGSVNAMDGLYKLSQQVGISTESLSQLEYAAQLSGTSLDGLRTGLLRLSRTASDAANGMTTAQRAFDAIGVSAKKADGTLKSTDELLLEIAEQFSKYEDGAGKAALAQELFGRSGAQLIPLLNQGRDGIAELTAEADRLGLTVGTDAAQAAERFNDNLTRMATAFKGVITQASQRLLPTMEAVAQSFVDTVSNAEFLERAIGFLDKSFKGLVSTGLVVAASFKTIGTVLGAAAAAVVQRDFNIIRMAFEDLRNDATDTIETIFNLWGPAAERAANELEAPMENIKRQLNFGTGDGAAGPSPIEVMSEQAKRAEQIFAQTRTEFERFVEAQNEAFSLMREGLIDEETYWRFIDQLEAGLIQMEEQAEETTSAFATLADEAARGMQRHFSEFLFDPFADGLKGMLRGFADTLRRMLAEAASAQILGALMGGLGGSSNAFLAGIGKAFGGGKASGGPVSSSKSYLVGERGPELFIPGASGSIVPNHAMGGGVTVNIDARQSDDPGRLLALVPVIQNQIEQGMALKMRRGYL
jgi:hypothetical protein